MKPQDLLARLEAGYEYDPMYGELCNERDQLKAENAKLRELADRMLGSIRCFEVMLGSVRFFKERSDSYSVSSVYEQWMRELGIEVDG